MPDVLAALLKARDNQGQEWSIPIPLVEGEWLAFGPGGQLAEVADLIEAFGPITMTSFTIVADEDFSVSDHEEF